MNVLLQELGKKLADRWLAALLPGLLWACGAMLAWQLGWRHALDPRIVGAILARWVDSDHPAGQITVLLLGALIASAVLTDARFAHERRHDDDHGPAVRDHRRRHAGGLIVTTSRRGWLRGRQPGSPRAAAAPLPLLGAGAPAVRVGLPSAIRST